MARFIGLDLTVINMYLPLYPRKSAPSTPIHFLISRKRLDGSGLLNGPWPNDDEYVLFFASIRNLLSVLEIEYISAIQGKSNKISFSERVFRTFFCFMGSHLLPSDFYSKHLLMARLSLSLPFILYVDALP